VQRVGLLSSADFGSVALCTGLTECKKIEE
jgi:hypothetical protein